MKLITPILKLLKDERIFSIILDKGNKELYFEEECDNHFGTSLNKQQVDELITELNNIRNLMV